MRTHTSLASLAILLSAACGGAPFEAAEPGAEGGPSVAVHDPPEVDAGHLLPDAPTGAQEGGEAGADSLAPEGGPDGDPSAADASEAGPVPEAGQLADASAGPCSSYNGGSGCLVGTTCVASDAGAFDCCATGDSYCHGQGGCIDTHASDTGNCGGCGIACPASDVCSAGQCVIYDGGVGPSQCDSPTNQVGGFQPPSVCDVGPGNYCEVGTLSGCLVTSGSPTGFGPIGTDVPECTGNAGEYPCCLSMEEVVDGLAVIDCECSYCQ